jgi:hypothetical protein
VQGKKPIYFGSMPVFAMKAPAANITSVTAVNALNFTVNNAWLVPTSGQLLGTSRDPEKDDLPGWEWSDRESAQGMTLPAGYQEFDLVLEVERDGAEGSADAVRVDYTWNGESYYWLYPVQVRLTQDAQECQSS